MERDAVLALLLSGQKKSALCGQRGTPFRHCQVYNTSVARLRDANRRQSDTIQVGQVLNLEMSSAAM